MSLLDGVSRLKGSLDIPATEVSGVRTSNKPATDKASTEDIHTGDAATISPTSGLIAEALSTSDVRSAKIDALRSSIADGSYSVSSAKIAAKIIDSFSS